MKRLALTIFAASVFAGPALADSRDFKGHDTFQKTCQFPNNGTSSPPTGLWGNWPACGDANGPLVPGKYRKCIAVWNVTAANNNRIGGGSDGHVVVLNDGNQPGSSTTQFPFVLPYPSTITQGFVESPLVFRDKKGLFVYDRGPGGTNSNVWVTVTGEYVECRW
ncbi:hypothetical protein [Methylocystis sp. ATCC 49242]|uniref:hypothetical protein n=1 Tax=Methylocystis sp. ATCC 49242 TaxID=622637 RepID=UPI0001F87BBB|nr:hypothetical protein [Methylocystis sp. ATCC 49242]